ncbi:UDP-N-acetylmuramyl pentapeptide phosphotransferase [Brevibacillus humidisoli]|uniref:UDP-N-acetylmuramyl pentapeptide phosphotransferase n=1 Tax=Brevibacillus humidisoli TaxID=2895522 RepID=UPI001E61F03A|nr:UDP-N-acetylmuramyl pentapeptide phosphotransferase [Brevibacillus humidisoli]UFJ42891.1 UDP-N-acetylmuramyl pentapeptide phosphotransferase [Brevibacillus humidisoli]
MSGSWRDTSWLLLLSVLIPVCCHLLCYRRFRWGLIRQGLVRRNYRNKRIPTSGGMLLASAATLAMLIVTSLGWLTGGIVVDGPTFLLFCCGSLIMLLLGWQDDRANDGSNKGFRGHLHAFWSERRLTSGLVKCVGGGLTALLLSIALSQGVEEVLVHAGLLALFSNLINLFDLRPTRALKAFWLSAAALLTTVPSLLFSPAVWVWILPVMTASILFFGPDARGQMMLGDAGANYLGFLLGFGSLLVLPFTAKAAVLIVLIVLHLLAEMISFTRIIEAVPLLRRLDEWGRPV